ncbi:16S rRNA (cytidine(1402)-2'-O)-methyltransferase [Leptolyngbya sp. FACHB-261]|uniref:16S rRNA (cytidine(1402)-2'-O)-methyltransferase n=1 Tax=Leptolyngbya sp. FACHB-261 TaxID=2692806 RepID=UPI00168890A3|nr:16S rRNA (cytidine(1402)-2'-O)-methyltransferase [Leptolyngbya sp. FACHB-261]MBD2103802.1 16S rRNA (cytidine(1402)-2'-O)-methyltransferase [Leptolyngbya sp. FACHB-261]
MDSPTAAGTLYLVGTPIGNLEDMTFRAVRVLQSVDLIAAEDTRHTGKLLRHFQIQTPQTSYHSHNQRSRTSELVSRLQEGSSIALVTDAGMPGISDPGEELVQACAEAGVPVVPIPGPTAVITALSASGLATARFAFEGFLPLRGAERREHLEQLRYEPRTLLLYEAPHRLRQTLADLAAILGQERSIALGRELTKLHEQIWRGTLAEALTYYQSREPQGEFTLVVAGALPTQAKPSDGELRRELQSLIGSGLSRSEASRQLAETTQLPRRHLYQLALSLEDEH